MLEAITPDTESWGDGRMQSPLALCIVLLMAVPEERPAERWELIGCPFPDYAEEIEQIERSFNEQSPVDFADPDQFSAVLSDTDMPRLVRRSPRRVQYAVTSSDSGSSVDSRSPRRQTFLGKLWSLIKKVIRAWFQLSCVLLLGMTLISVLLAVGSALVSTAYDLFYYILYSVEASDYKTLSLALIGVAAYTVFLVLTLLAGIMLIPALWVSVFDIVGFPWNVPFFDAFIP